MAITDDIEQLYEGERYLIEEHWQDERRLNMIPGGKAGLRYLRENSILRKGQVVTPDEREGILEAWLDGDQDRKLPPLSLAERWQDDSWASAQICSRSDRLSITQITAIRELSVSHSVDEIAHRTGATISQVQRVIAGKSYTRVI
ncbi:hypothetical protein KUC85_01250 [Pseudomonas aeruginosa]|uniref:hypothetical protein n=1 Tax=Pseudomonas aeruginosa TaxID=287 RepID=UPI000CFECC50|nr:hypothetical protein [Pseudomonas aeruginosa]MBH4429375.1 hypothetical protein [Pseudomonas aeruginosa]MBH4482668.1 hypothetical protein [Pseudomonas aeruginosa]MCV0027227.1 hypothetical protein [Pseudomonas aeruginosa]MDY1062232.1 hypothetical protein [Pseudomonas aeruginosa]RUI41282.1 hypothetical protein IPC414_07765 [Pseudomonas aeruginosa]